MGWGRVGGGVGGGSNFLTLPPSRKSDLLFSLFLSLSLLFLLSFCALLFTGVVKIQQLSIERRNRSRRDLSRMLTPVEDLKREAMGA